MSEIKHTPEPWIVSSHDKSIVKCYQGEQTPHGTTPYFAGGGALESERNANAKRLVACVNACAGISTERLEKFLGATANKSVITLTTDNIDLKKQRDDLLVAMEKAREEMSCANFNSAAERIDHAIAAVKGQS